MSNRPIWHFCPFALNETQCGGTCSNTEGMRCAHLIFAELNEKAFKNNEKMLYAAHRTIIGKEIAK